MCGAGEHPGRPGAPPPRVCQALSSSSRPGPASGVQPEARSPEAPSTRHTSSVTQAPAGLRPGHCKHLARPQPDHVLSLVQKPRLHVPLCLEQYLAYRGQNIC